MALVDRARDIILKPKETWPVIAAEPATVGSIYSGYIVPLAAIPAVCSFLGSSFLFNPLGFSPLRFVTQAVIQYVLTLAGCYVLALIAEALAPSFGGTKDRVAALKWVAYAYTPAWVAGVFLLFPPLAILAVIAALYGLYLLYLGATPVMAVPADKAAGYTIVQIVVSIVVTFVIATIVTAIVTMAFVTSGALYVR